MRNICFVMNAHYRDRAHLPPEAPSFRVGSLIIPVLLFVFFTVSFFGSLTKAEAAPPPEPTWMAFESRTSQVTYWFRGWDGNTRHLINSIDRNLSTLTEHPLFKGTLPSRWSILIDGVWTGASGYWAPNLTAPDGTSAVLVKPQAILDPEQGWSLIAHELTHLVHYSKRPHESGWVQEGAALLSEFIVTNKLNPVFALGFNEPETSLITSMNPLIAEEDPANIRPQQYGHVLQYFYYLYRLCGGNQFLNELLSSPSTTQGVSFLDELLISASQKNLNLDPVCVSFEKSFRSFEVARFKQNKIFPSQYVHFGTFKATVRDAKVKLPMYSASAYTKKPKAPCAPNEVTWSTDKCIQLRLE